MEGNTTKLGADFTKSEPNSSKMEEKRNEATKEIAEIEAMVSELKEHLVRALAENENLKKQTFEKAFEKHGLKRIFPQGEKFDHNHHQAISQVKQEGVDAGIVINVVQAGYVLEERVLKPAMVVVSS